MKIINKIYLYAKKFFKYIYELIHILQTLRYLKKDIFEIQQSLKFIEKNIIYKSNLFDFEYYNNQYGYNYTKYEAIENWYKYWRIKHESPSKYINIEYCIDHFNIINPILCYLSYGKEKNFYANYSNNIKLENPKQIINIYLKKRYNLKIKKCIYTCITNNYDDIYEIETYNTIDHTIDYICFTDNYKHIQKKNIGIWKILPLAYDCKCNSKNNRWHKLHPHILFPNYEESIYIDANINIISDFIYNIFEHSTD